MMMNDSRDCEVEELGHTSEIGLAAKAPTLAALFSCLARAMVALTGVTADGSESAARDAVPTTIELNAVDLSGLLVDWLNEIVYLYEVTGRVPAAIDVHAISPTAIAATVVGQSTRGAPELQIKAVTYHQLSIRQENEHWKAEVFFDI
jgi:SHS2 domain-containing protein